MHLPHTTLRRLLAVLAGLNRKTTLPRLHHLYFTPVGPHLVLNACDLDFHLHWPLPTASFDTLERPASCPIDWFIKIAKSVRKDGHLELRLTQDGHSLCAYPSTGPSARSPERSLPIAEMPGFSTAGFTRGGWLSHATLEHIIAAKDFISEDQTRYVLNGSLITSTGHCVATDGRRLIHRATTGTVLPQDIILPPQYFAPLAELATGELSEGLADGGGKKIIPGTRLAVWLPTNGADKMLVQSGSLLLTVKLIEGNFPNWKQVVPGGSAVLVDLDPAFLDTLRTTLSRSPNRSNTTVTFDIDSDRTTRASIYTYSKGAAESTQLLDPHFPVGKHVSGPPQPFRIAFNANYLLPALQTTGHRLRLIDDKSPGLTGDPLTGEAVLMPMRVNA